MRNLRRLFGFKKSDEAAEDSAQVSQDEQHAALVDDPVRFAEWVGRHALQEVELERDVELCPSEEQCQRLEITVDQREACRREFTIMRALGACMFVGRNLSSAYYGTFKHEICATMAGIFYGVPTEGRIDEMSSVIDAYTEALGEESATAFSLSYLGRVYAGNRNQAGMFAAGIFQIPLQVAMGVFEAVQDAYTRLKFGLPFKVVEALEKVAEKADDPKV